MKHKKRILFGAVDTGYRIEHYTKYIENHFSDKLIAESFSKYILPSSQYKVNYTYTCPIDKTHPLLLYAYSSCFFIFSLFRYDIFHFISGETILTRKLRRFELAVYKLFGKRVIMHLVGSDVRSEEFIYWKEKNIKKFLAGEHSVERNLPWQKKLIADIEKYVDFILVSTPDLKQFIRNAVYYPVLIDLEKFLNEVKPVPPSRKKPGDEIVILHAPSNTALKGTVHIHEVLKKLKDNPSYNIRLILPGEKILGTVKKYAVTRYELFEIYKEVDIMIDQMIIGWYGLQSIEALCTGKEVISHVDKDLERDLFPHCPIKLASVNTLEQVIINCIENIYNGSISSYEDKIDWVKRYHTIENNNTPLLRAWDITNINE